MNNRPRSRFGIHPSQNTKKTLALLVPPAVVITMLVIIFVLQPSLKSSANESVEGIVTAEVTNHDGFLEVSSLLASNSSNSSTAEQNSNMSTETIGAAENGASLNIQNPGNNVTKTYESSISVSIINDQTSGSESNGVTPTILVNGEEIVIPENGRIREKFEDENSTTRIRANIDGEGSSSINISTDSKYDESKGD